ncbi:hypothetical protein N7528_007491 [Penicillium herquei]|nr:hypothetical protein N7528_007491 [Penicillium herquei]
MAEVDTSTLDVYVAFCKRRGNHPLHWMIMLVHPGSDRCTWYHVVGGPTQGRPYEPKIEANKRVDSTGISSKQWICQIAASGSNLEKIKAATKAVPAQYFEVLGILEGKEIVPSGTKDLFQTQIEPNLYANDQNDANT